MPMSTNDRRHVFLQRAQGAQLATLDQRAEASSPLAGAVLEAVYFTTGRARPTREGAGVAGAAPQGFWAWLKGLFDAPSAAPPGGSRSPSTRGGSAVRWVLPFDDAGDDALGLCAEDVPALDGHDDPIGSVRRVVGTVVCLEPRRDGDEVVARDLWIEGAPALRLVEVLDFAVQPEYGPPIAVCCAMAPILIAPPTRITPRTHCEALSPRAREWLAPLLERREDAPGTSVRIEAGAQVEVTGVVGEPTMSAARFDVRGRAAPYRGASHGVMLLVGDEPGTRLVLRQLEG